MLMGKNKQTPITTTTTKYAVGANNRHAKAREEKLGSETGGWGWGGREQAL